MWQAAHITAILCAALAAATLCLGCASRTGKSPDVGSTGRGLFKSPAPEYDKAMIGVIQHKWFSLLESVRPSEMKNADRLVIVTIEFLLHPDGTISTPTVKAGHLEGQETALAVRAVTDSAPFARWTEEVRQIFGEKPRECRISFHYEPRRSGSSAP